MYRCRLYTGAFLWGYQSKRVLSILQPPWFLNTVSRQDGRAGWCDHTQAPLFSKQKYKFISLSFGLCLHAGRHWFFFFVWLLFIPPCGSFAAIRVVDILFGGDV